jgi:ABC-type branched-subunit amino acid transport system ATPase component
MLRAEGIAVSFGGVRAVDDVSLAAGRDELVGLVGPNGSGKTTLLNALCGVVPAEGRVTVDGRPLRLGHPTSTARAGVARVFQTPQVFDRLTCLENVMLGSSDRRGRGLAGVWLGRWDMWRREDARAEAAAALLERVGLAEREHEPASVLSYGQRRLLELARALASDPTVLLLDEPSAGLNDAETAALAELLVGLRRTGRALVVVDHKVDFLDQVCDRLVVLELGRVIAEGPPDAVWSDRRVVDAYLGVADEDEPDEVARVAEGAADAAG